MTRLHFHLLPLKRDTLDRSLPVCIPMNRDYDRQATGRPACSLIEGGQARLLPDRGRAGPPAP